MGTCVAVEATLDDNTTILQSAFEPYRREMKRINSVSARQWIDVSHTFVKYQRFHKDENILRHMRGGLTFFRELYTFEILYDFMFDGDDFTKYQNQYNYVIDHLSHLITGYRNLKIVEILINHYLNRNGFAPKVVVKLCCDYYGDLSSNNQLYVQSFGFHCMNWEKEKNLSKAASHLSIALREIIGGNTNFAWNCMLCRAYYSYDDNAEDSWCLFWFIRKGMRVNESQCIEIRFKQSLLGIKNVS